MRVSRHLCSALCIFVKDEDEDDEDEEDWNKSRSFAK
jgi:hypothetical protein